MNWKDKGGAWLALLGNTEHALGIPEDLLARQCKQESDFNPQALNPKSGCVGIMQLLPADFPGAGLNPVKDIKDAGAYLVKLEKEFGDWQLALAAYDWGPGNLRKWEHAGSQWPLMPNETRNYVTQIIGDVPVQGSLCKTPNQTNQVGAGSPVKKPSVEPSSGSSSGSSLSSRLMNIFRKSPPPNSQSSSPGLSKPSVLISSQLNKEPEPMNQVEQQALTAIAPALNNVLDAVTQFAVDLGPNVENYKLTALPALQKMLGTIELQIPVAASEGGTLVQSFVSSKVAELKAKLASQISAPTLHPLQPSPAA
jgi:Transglycosylase SLT domain